MLDYRRAQLHYPLDDSWLFADPMSIDVESELRGRSLAVGSRFGLKASVRVTRGPGAAMLGRASFEKRMQSLK